MSERSHTRNVVVQQFKRGVGRSALAFAIGVAVLTPLIAAAKKTGPLPALPGSAQLRDGSITVRYPDGWSISTSSSDVPRLLKVAAERQAALGLEELNRTPQIAVFTEQRRDHAEAIQRLREIAAEVDSAPTYLNIGGWPAMQRRFLAAKPEPLDRGESSSGKIEDELQLNITTVVATGKTIVRLDGRLMQGDASTAAAQIEAIGQSLVFASDGNAAEVEAEIEQLRRAPSLRTPSATRSEAGSSLAMPAPAQAQISTEILPDIAVPVGSGSELSVAASRNARNIVIGSNSNFFFSTDSGSTWRRSVGLSNTSDPQLAWGQSGTFYAANIGGASTPIDTSPTGQTFTFRANAFTCPGTPPSCGGFPFPDQEQIAADGVNAAPGGDRVYSVWRHGGGSYGIVCSANSGTTWSGTAAGSFTSGDFARITVGPDGSVFVVFLSGGSIMLNRYNPCNGNAMQPVAGFPRTVVGGASLACEIPGLDRCPSGSIHTVAVDDGNPSHVYVAYVNSSGGNENVVVQDSVDGGTTWSTNPGDHRIVTVNTALSTRRFMPWVCSAGGSARVTWYDRRAATPCATPPCAQNNDLTDFFAGTALLDGSGNLIPGPEFRVNELGTADPQCASGATPGSAASWPCGTRGTASAEGCSVQPQLAGKCCLPCPQGPNDPCSNNGSPCGAGSTRGACDFDQGPACPAGESCSTERGCPKYGDYNGNACAAGRLLSAWASAAPATGPGNINIFFSATLVSGPQIQVPGNVFFDPTCVGSVSVETLNVCNTGVDNLEVASITSSNSAQFNVTTPSSGFPVVISPDFCFPFQVTFRPSDAGPRSATLTITSNDLANPTVAVTASGTGIEPNIATLIANSGSFGDVCVDSFRDRDLTISNSGGCTLTVTNITSSSGQFQVPSTLFFPLSIGPGDSLAVPIRFAPTSLGAKSATITITSDDPDSPIKNVQVSGNVPPGDIRVTGSTSFGDVCPGIIAEKTVRVCNVGACDLHVTSAAFVPACPDFTLVNNPFPATVSHDSCLDLVIRFTPTSLGPKSCTLVITSDDPDTPAVSLTVTGNTPAPSIDVPDDLGFPPTVLQSVGACVTPEPFPVSNTGTCLLTITNFRVSTNPVEYSLSGLPSFPILLEPGHEAGEGDLEVQFRPATLDRDLTGTLSVTYLSDPITGATTTVERAVCGEGVRTGARVLVKAGGIPLPSVERIQLQRINANRNRRILDTNDVSRNLPLQTETPDPPCAPFQFHQEYGTVGNPIQLLPGSYQVTVTAIVNGRRARKTVGFDVNTCTFNPNIVVDF